MAKKIRRPSCEPLVSWLREATPQDISKIGVCRSMVYQISRGIRPSNAKRSVLIEQATGGRVTRKDLHPDDWHEIWPELAA